MPTDSLGNWYPHRRSETRCSVCERHFAQGTVPTPDSTGARVCRDCRAEYYARHLPLDQPADPPF